MDAGISVQRSCIHLLLSTIVFLRDDSCHSSDLSNLASWLNLAKERSNIQSAIEVDSTQNHTLTLDAHHLARSKVGYEQYVLANQLLWLVVGCDT